MASLLTESVNSNDLDIEEGLYNTMGARRIFLSNSMQTCKFHQKGNCGKGADCLYRHSKGEKNTVCKHWIRGLCKKMDYCEFLHLYDLNKMPVCHFFREYGKCSRPECHFLHITKENQVKDCPWYDRGFCKHGPNCRNRHVRRRACLDYLAGFCPKGPQCSLSHPRFELPDLDRDNSRTNNRNTICSNCNLPGHTEAECTILPEESRRKLNMRPLEEVICFKCKEHGHYADLCPNRQRGGRVYPRGRDYNRNRDNNRDRDNHSMYQMD